MGMCNPHNFFTIGPQPHFLSSPTSYWARGATPTGIFPSQNYYILGPWFYTNPMPASAAITRTSVYNNPNVTTDSIALLAVARLAEVGVRLCFIWRPPIAMLTVARLAEVCREGETFLCFIWRPIHL